MRMTRKKGLDNRGSTLILVVICAAFIMILSSVILSLTVTNRQMKRIEHDIKDNFYSAETALDEIKAGLEEHVAASLEEAYAGILDEFTSLTEQEKRDKMNKDFLDKLQECLSMGVGAGFYNINMLEGFLRVPVTLDIAPGENLLKRDGDNSITLMNVKIAYEDDQGYFTTISTDILIGASPTSFSLSFTSPAFSEYALIADKQIRLDGTGLANGAKAKGSIYSGEGGLLIDNSKLGIDDARNVVSRGDIDVESNSVLTIDDKPSIWVNNIKVNSDTTNEFELDIDGKCYVADNLTINGNKSKVRVKGEYYGYSYESYNDMAPSPSLTAQGNSAIVINGKNAGLEFKDMDALMISGRAFLSSDYVGDTDGIYTGESITVKEMQLAYFIPKDYIWCGSNPVTYDEYLAKPSGDLEVDFTRSSTFPINIEDYADGFLNLHYVHHGEKYKYYYLKFKSEAKANEYMQKYFEEFANGSSEVLDIDELVGRNVESIIIDDTISNIFLTAGNILTYRANTSDFINSSVDYGGLSLTAMESLSKQLAKRYDSMTRNLKVTASNPPFDYSSLYNSIIDRGKVDISPSVTRCFAEVDGVSSFVYIINNPSSTYYINNIPLDERKGIVIANGSVCVNTDYQGLILADEDIELKAGVTVTASKELVEGILRLGNPDINRYFRSYASFTAPSPGPSSSAIAIKDMISFENWKKNK